MFSLVSFQNHFAKNRTYLVSTAKCKFVCASFYVVFVKSSEKLLHYLMFGQTLIEMKMETLKTQEFHSWLNFVTFHVIGERMEVTPMVSIDPHSAYHFGYPLF